MAEFNSPFESILGAREECSQRLTKFSVRLVIWSVSYFWWSRERTATEYEALFRATGSRPVVQVFVEAMPV
jgi:hypothetical protein